MKDKYLLYAQIVLIVLLFYFGNFAQIFQNPALAVIFATGSLLALYSFYNLGLDTFTPYAEPKKESKHVQSGAYNYMRHPMYLGIMLISLALLFSAPSFPATVIYLLLIYVLDAKASLEEEYLTKLHPTYKNYQDKTKKFIPYIY